MQQLNLKRLFTILFHLLLTINSFSQSDDSSLIEGQVLITFSVFPLKLYDSYILIEESNMKVRIDSTGSFQLTNLKSGEYHLKFNIWDGLLNKDTVINVQQDFKNFMLHISYDCEVNKLRAMFDLKYSIPRLLISGGISPIVYLNQNEFEEKYRVKYHDFGCHNPGKCMEEYNQEIFRFLDQTYGRKWRKEVRKDVEGFRRRSK